MSPSAQLACVSARRTTSREVGNARPRRFADTGALSLRCFIYGFMSVVALALWMEPARAQHADTPVWVWTCNGVRSQNVVPISDSAAPRCTPSSEATWALIYVADAQDPYTTVDLMTLGLVATGGLLVVFGFLAGLKR